MHVNLGMTIDDIKSMLNEVPADIDDGTVTTLASRPYGLNNVLETICNLPGRVIRCITIPPSCCSYVGVPNSALCCMFCTRATAPFVDDYMKLGRTMQYLCESLLMLLTFEANKANIIK